MKKIVSCFALLSAFLLASCDVPLAPNEETSLTPEHTTGQTVTSIEESVPTSLESEVSEKTSEEESSTPVESDLLPLAPEETIKSNVDVYSQTFQVTLVDEIKTYDLRYDTKTKNGLLAYQEFTLDHEPLTEAADYFILLGKGNEGVVYYENDEYHSCGYKKDRDVDVDLFYVRLLFDISNEILGEAHYRSKTPLTYAGRQATKYALKDGHVTLTDSVDIILDDETGAVLSVVYDFGNWYETSAFSPNDKAAEDAILAKKAEAGCEYLEPRALDIVGLAGIPFPDWYFDGASTVFKDGSSRDYSNLSEYHVGYHEPLKDTAILKDLCQYVYDQGIQYIYDKESGASHHEFEELFEDKIMQVTSYIAIHVIQIHGYAKVGGEYYWVKLQARDPNDGAWHVSLEIIAPDA